MTTPTGSYLCPHCGRTTRTREDDPKNCVVCDHIMYWRPDDEGDRCTFCGCGENDHYWFCEYWDIQSEEQSRIELVRKNSFQRLIDDAEVTK